MSQIPSTPQTPAAADPVVAPAAVDVPPPDMSTPGVGPTTPDATPTETPAADTGLQELGQYFGVPSGEGSTAESTAAALRPVIDMIARGGMNQRQQQQQASTYEQHTPTQESAPRAGAPAPNQVDPSDFAFDDIDLGEASPEIVKAFKAMGARSQQAIQAIQAQAEAAKNSAERTQQHLQNQANHAQQQQESEVSNRAVGYLDSLASAKYGVGQNRTLVQQIAAEQVMTHAGHIIRGMQSYGKTLPIESVMQAAVLAVEGTLPTAPTPGLPTPATALSPQSPQGGALPMVKNVGSAGGGDAMLNDAEFMDGARAILNR